MMDFLEAALLGLIQGLTEFLPVSSSGHLEIAKFIFNDESIQEQSFLFTVTLHVATALSTIVVFWKDIVSIISGLFKRNQEDFEFAVKIIISMIPAVIVGLVFEDLIDSFFNGRILLVCCMLLITGCLLFVADRSKTTDKSVSYLDALIIGVAQMIAILPGISRSGSTIATSVLLKIDRYKAARFSFLMVVPLILGKLAKDILGGDFNIGEEAATELGIGFVVAFITGILACKLMIKLVQMSRLSYFAYYCFLVGVGLLMYLFVF